MRFKETCMIYETFKTKFVETNHWYSITMRNLTMNKSVFLW